MTATATPTTATPVRGVRVMAGLCGVTSFAFAALWLSDTSDPVRMPVLPHWATALFAGLATLLLLQTFLHGGIVLAAGAVSCAGMLAGSLFAIPHTVLMVAVWIGGRFTGDTGSFDVDPVWWMTIAHVLNMVAASIFGRWLLRRWRAHLGRCTRCGRLDAVKPDTDGARVLPWLALITVLACLPYGLLKLAWGLGSRVGLTGHAFDDVSLASPGFGDTVVLTAVSIATCVVMGMVVRHRLLRRTALAMGTLGSLMLVPVGVAGAVMSIIVAFTGRVIDDSEIAPWAFGIVFASFLAWGVGLAVLTVRYWRVTRSACDDSFHGVR